MNDLRISEKIRKDQQRALERQHEAFEEERKQNRMFQDSLSEKLRLRLELEETKKKEKAKEETSEEEKEEATRSTEGRGSKPRHEWYWQDKKDTTKWIKFTGTFQ